MASPVVLIGTGTSIGKTHVAERLLRAAGADGLRSLGYKPVESGIRGDEPDTDEARMARASSFHVKQTRRYTLPEPISPHLAARHAGVTFDIPAIVAEVARLAALADLLILELPGGAFSPFTDDLLAVDVARRIAGASIVLVAPDRLGVLHDLGACSRACAVVGLPLRGIVLNAPETPDASTGTNAGELSRVTRLPLLGSLPRGAGDAPVAPNDPARGIVAALLNR